MGNYKVGGSVVFDIVDDGVGLDLARLQSK